VNHSAATAGGGERDARGVERVLGRAVAMLGAAAGLILVAVAVTAGANLLGLLTRREAMFALLPAFVYVAAFASRRPKQVLLFAWIFSLTYNRQFFSFEGIVGNSGPAGLYWIAADVFFAGLLAIWAVEVLARRHVTLPGGLRVWPWYMPYFVACGLSVLAADRLDWGAFELLRTLKFTLVLLYVAANVGRREWWLCLAAFGAGLSAQSALGTLEVATKRTGVLWIIGLQDDIAAVPQLFRDEGFYGWARATATMAHPPNLACYLLLTLPPFIALALCAPDRRWQTLCAAVSVLGLVGLACTLSRFPVVVMAMQLCAMGVALIALRAISIKRVIALLAIGGTVLMIALSPFSDLIADRIARDFDRSIDLRTKEFGIAWRMLEDNPLLGVGLNNYTAHLVAYGSEMSWGLNPKYRDLATHELHVRYVSGPLNTFLLIAAETGMLGLLGFVVWVLGIVVVAGRTISRVDGAARIACVGLVTGALGALVQQAVDYSYWADPIFYSSALVVALLGKAPALFGVESTPSVMPIESASVPAGAA
jgi:O-antigen ligase